jgi:hypothetical protein
MKRREWMISPIGHVSYVEYSGGIIALVYPQVSESGMFGDFIIRYKSVS